MAESEEKRITVKVAYNYFQAGNWDRALEEYKKLIAIDPMDFLVHNMLAEIYSRKGDKAAAIVEYLNAAGLLKATNNMEKAVQAYARILKLEPTHAEAKEKIEEVIKVRMVEVHGLIQRGLLKQAMELCERLGAKVPDHPLILEKIKEIEAFQKEPPAPSGQKPSAVETAPNAVPAGDYGVVKREEVIKNLYAMADMYQGKQAWDEAVEAYITILRFTPEDDSARAKLHALYRKITRQDKAVEVWGRIQSEDKRRLEQAKRIAKEPSKPAEPKDAGVEAPAEVLGEPRYSVPKRAELGDLAEMERLRLEAESRLRRAVEDRRERDKNMRETQGQGGQAPESGVSAPVEAASAEQDIGVLTTQVQMYIQQNLLVEAMRLAQRILELDPLNQDIRGLLQKIFERKKI